MIEQDTVYGSGWFMHLFLVLGSFKVRPRNDAIKDGVNSLGVEYQSILLGPFIITVTSGTFPVRKKGKKIVKAI